MNIREIVLAAVLLLAIIWADQARANSYCRDHLAEQGLEVTAVVTITGDHMTSDTWTVDHNTISITFDNEVVMVWNPRTVERHLALMDWIGTAEHYQAKTGVPPFAGRNVEGRVWLISQTTEADETALPRCFAHPLDPLD